MLPLTSAQTESPVENFEQTLEFNIRKQILYLTNSLSTLLEITLSVAILTRVGHAYAKYAKYADYAHMRNMRMRMRIENLIHIFHIQREKTSLFKRQ